jgi:electron transfer flavoprotein beta subunit
VIGVCWKWVTAGATSAAAGHAGADERWAGVSESDRAALEVALGLAASTGDDVTVVSAGGQGAEVGLREALAVGAARAVRVDVPADLESAAVAGALAAVLAGAAWVVCGDASADRGSGSVPAFVAAELGAAQALGLVAVTVASGGVSATRRLDAGRREVLAVSAPAVLSVEGAAARLRRASLPAELAARRATIDVVPGPTGPVEHPDAVQRYRPRARVLAAPVGAALTRVLQLTDAAGASSTTHELVTLEPADAADRILAALAEWGYLTPAT